MRGADALAQPGEKHGPLVRLEDVPHLGLRLAAVFRGRVVVRMNLYAQPFAGVDQLDQQRKAVPLAGGTEQRSAELAAESSQVAVREGTRFDDAHAIGMGRNLPRLGATRRCVRAAEARGDLGSTPQVVAVDGT